VCELSGGRVLDGCGGQHKRDLPGLSGGHVLIWHRLEFQLDVPIVCGWHLFDDFWLDK
jgi:hypothetical protein